MRKSSDWRREYRWGPMRSLFSLLRDLAGAYYVTDFRSEKRRVKEERAQRRIAKYQRDIERFEQDGTGPQ